MNGIEIAIDEHEHWFHTWEHCRKKRKYYEGREGEVKEELQARMGEHFDNARYATIGGRRVIEFVTRVTRSGVKSVFWRLVGE